MFNCKLIQRKFLNQLHYRFRYIHKLSKSLIKLSEEVNDSILSKKPVVALESTVITHGLPYPDNLKCALRLEEIVRSNKAVPATIGILNGEIHIGMESSEIEILASSKNTIKVSRRDLPYVISKKLNGGTTVAATMILAHQAGIPIFATGGIGGVHRGAETTMDVSADLYELSKTPMTVISAGVKSILDIGLTLEYLETLGVCVATFGKSKLFPSFFTQHSDFSSSCNIETISEAAHLINSRDQLHLDSGILIAVPIPEMYEKEGQLAHSVIEKALEDAQQQNVTGKSITPFVLERVRALTDGASLKSNIGLLENNVNIGSQIAVELNEIQRCNNKLYSPKANFSSIKSKEENVNSSCRPVVIGGSILDIHVKILEDIKMDGRTIDGKVQSTAGGVGRNLADCMARLGANPFFISLVGAQEYAETLLSKMDHMDKKGIEILQDARTATCIVILDNKGECAFVVGDMSIHDQLLPNQVEIHEDMISRAPLVLIDGNIPVSTMNCIMNLCSKHQIPVWFEPTDISRAFRPFLDSTSQSAIAYASPNLNELKVMHDTICGKDSPPLKADCLERKIEESLQLGVPLLNDILHTIIVTLSSDGILLITNVSENNPFPTKSLLSSHGKVRAIHYPAPVPDNIVSVSGAGDCFAASMASAIIKGLDPENCINAGQQAAILSLASHYAVPNTMCSKIVSPENVPKMKKRPITVM